MAISDLTFGWKWATDSSCEREARGKRGGQRSRMNFSSSSSWSVSTSRLHLPFSQLNNSFGIWVISLWGGRNIYWGKKVGGLQKTKIQSLKPIHVVPLQYRGMRQWPPQKSNCSTGYCLQFQLKQLQKDFKHLTKGFSALCLQKAANPYTCCTDHTHTSKVLIGKTVNNKPTTKAKTTSS